MQLLIFELGSGVNISNNPADKNAFPTENNVKYSERTIDDHNRCESTG